MRILIIAAALALGIAPMLASGGPGLIDGDCPLADDAAAEPIDRSVAVATGPVESRPVEPAPARGEFRSESRTAVTRVRPSWQSRLPGMMK